MTTNMAPPTANTTRISSNIFIDVHQHYAQGSSFRRTLVELKLSE